jgi:hypothetical protein
VKRTLPWLGGLLGVVLLIWLPRGLDLDRMVTPDEPLWLARSANFAQALSDDNLDQTYQYAHPGVTVMWAGALAFRIHAGDYITDGPDTIRQRNNAIAGDLSDLGISPLRTLATAREVMVLIVVAVLAATGWFAVRLFGRWPGIAGTAILATDPFHVALSRLLHLDALFSSLMGLAAVVWLSYLLDGRRRRDLVIAGAVIGLAGLTRTLAIVLLPMMLVSACVELMPAAGSVWRRAWAVMLPLIAAGGIAFVTFVALWPALWSSPIRTVHKMVTIGFNLAETAHVRPIFFNGAIYHGTSPGWLFYPISFIWRTTPALLIGLLFAVIAGCAAVRTLVGRGPQPVRNRAPGYLLVLVVTVLLVLELSDKKLDRYIVAVIPPLSLLAGWGFGAVTAWLTSVLPNTGARPRAGWLTGGLCALLIAFNLLAIVRLHPYGLDYYNPMFGGAVAAKSDMMIGWGEGMDQVAAAIDSLPDAADARVLTSAWHTSLDYFVSTATISEYDFFAADALDQWLKSDYFVWYIASDQRGYVPPEMQDYFAHQTPVRTVQLGGIEYAALYDLRNAPLPAYFANQMWMTRIAPNLQLVKAILNADPLLPGQPVTTVLYLTGTLPVDAKVTVRLALTGPDGVTITGGDQSVRGDEAQTVWSVRRRIELPASARLGTYWVTAHFDGGTTTADVVLGSVTVQSEAASPTPTPIPDDEDLGEDG